MFECDSAARLIQAQLSEYCSNEEQETKGGQRYSKRRADDAHRNEDTRDHDEETQGRAEQATDDIEYQRQQTPDSVERPQQYRYTVLISFAHGRLFYSHLSPCTSVRGGKRGAL